MTRWFRVYDDLVDDPKVQRLRGDTFKALINLWCLASKNEGFLPSSEDIAFKLRMHPEKVSALLAGLRNSGFIDGDETDARPHNWDARQYKSDVSTERVKRFRKRQETVSVTPPDTDSEQKQSRTERAADAAPTGADKSVDVVDEDPQAKLFRIGKTILVSFAVAEKRTGSLIGQWLKKRNDPVGLLAAIQYARDQNVAEPVAYISAVLSRGSKNGHGQQSLGDIARELAAKARHLEREAGLFRPDDPVGSA